MKRFSIIWYSCTVVVSILVLIFMVGVVGLMHRQTRIAWLTKIITK